MTPEQELLERLRDEVARGDVEVREHDAAFVSLIRRRFPFLGSKIDWKHLPNAVEHTASTSDVALYSDEAERFVREISRSEKLGQQEKVAVVGDSAMSVALIMQLRVFVACMRRILAVPQHTYVVSLDGSWCIVFSMEGDLCFGRAPR